MCSIKTLRVISATLVALVLGLTVRADVIETKNGARLVGDVVLIDGLSVVLATEYAGEVKIKQSEVVSIRTDRPLNVRLMGGTVMRGTISSTGGGSLVIAGEEGSIMTNVSKVALTWDLGAKDPAIAALERVWTYQAGVDISGKTGNSDQLGTSVNFRATLTGVQDKLEFYSAYERQVSDNEKSADQFKAGVDYQNNFAGRYSWYVRDEAGFDRVKLVEFSNIAALGVGYDFKKTPRQTLTGRLGLAHRFESYKADPVIYSNLLLLGVPPADAARLATKENVNSAGLDIGLSHTLTLKDWDIINRISFVPAFEDFADYRGLHESFLQFPLKNPAWTLRVGVANDYTSRPSAGKEKLDTTYFTRLMVNWK